MKIISSVIIPLIVLGIIFYGFKKKVNVYDTFLEGAKEGLVMIFKLAPAIVAMVFAINIFIRSNVIYFVLGFLSDFFERINVPLGILPMAFVRPISGTASLAILANILQTAGPDSFIGLLASTLQGCTDTTIYVLALYFGSVKITKTRYALPVGLCADLVGIIASFIVVKWLFL